MSNVNVDVNVLAETVEKLNRVINDIDSTKKSVLAQYEALGNEWKDSKYEELGHVIHDCNSAFINVEKDLLNAQKTIVMLLKYVEEYENQMLMDNISKDTSFTRYVSYAIQSFSNPTSNAVRIRLNEIGVSCVNLDGIPTQTQEQIATAFENMSMLFPESVGSVYEISVSLNMESTTPASTRYSTDSGSLRTSMSINPSWFANENLESMIEENCNSGQWAGIGVPGIINHEVGHALHLQLDALELGASLGEPLPQTFDRNALYSRWVDNITTNDIRDTVLNNMGLTRDDICDLVSEYADYDGSECFAECVADASTNPNSNQLCANIIEEYRRRFNDATSGSYHLVYRRRINDANNGGRHL